MKRTVVIGLDGGSWDLTGPWLQNDDLRSLNEIRDHGVFADNYSYLPPVTVPSWKCYSTGKNPGKLGVYRFDHLDPRNRTYTFHDSTDFDSPELWDYLNDEGFRTAVVNMPTTYPPRPIDGAMISGGPDATEGDYRRIDDTYTYPPSLEAELERQYDYAVHPQPLLSSSSQRGEEVEAILDLIDLRLEVAYDMLTSGKYDFVHVTCFYLNTLQHYFWRAEPTRLAWNRIDDHLGRFLELDDTNVVVMSDHGCHEVGTLMYLNEWLVEEGYLSLVRSVDDLLAATGVTKERAMLLAKTLRLEAALGRLVPQRLQEWLPWDEGISIKRFLEKIDWEKTVAVGNSQGLVYLVPDRDTDEYEALRREVVEKLETLETPDGTGVAQDVHRFETIYDGDAVAEAPDIVVEFTPGIHISEKVGSDTVFPEDTGRWAAENVPKGMFAAAGPDVPGDGRIDDIRISDIAPTILDLYGCGVPTDMDGSPVKPLADGCQNRQPLASPHEKNRGSDGEQVRSRLEALGYLS